MSNTMATPRSPSTPTNNSDKVKKPSKVVVFRLPSERLAQFEEKHLHKPEPSSHTSEAPSPAPATDCVPTVKVTESTDAPSESNSTPNPGPEDPNTTSADPPKKRKGPAPGTKRSIGLTTDGMPKPRGKPGPKKKPRLEDGTIDHSTKPTAPTGVNHKLGPKANQGAINAGLRALDRSGKPCRKWGRKQFAVKSFTGVSWGLNSWTGMEKPPYLNGDDSSDTKDISMQSSSDIRPNQSDTAMDSNPGEHNDPVAMSTPMASSPPPIPAQSAVVAA